MLFFISVGHNADVGAADGNNRSGRQTDGGISFPAEFAAVDAEFILAISGFEINFAVFGNYDYLGIGVRLEYYFLVNCRKVDCFNGLTVNGDNRFKAVCVLRFINPERCGDN